MSYHKFLLFPFLSYERLNQSKEIGNLINLTLSHYSARHIRLLNTVNGSRRERAKKKNQESIFIFQHFIQLLQGVYNTTNTHLKKGQ